ncbi:MAG: c-type cytochrome [Burkholderiales bacterium]|nr:c-type cytochrome [Burkholderiales bacterium]
MFSRFPHEQGYRSAVPADPDVAVDSVRPGHSRLLRFATFVALTALAAPVVAADPVHGKELFDQYCVGCHGPSGQGGRKSGFMPRPQNLTKKDYIELLPDSYLFIVISQGGAAVGKSEYMPAFESTFKKEDIESLIAYIRTLTPH